jgi:hypothetical protein
MRLQGEYSGESVPLIQEDGVMPKITGISDQYQFHFFSIEGSGGQHEPIHVHIRRDSNKARF